MNFAIEVPGEATPLNLQELCAKLLLAGSTDHNQRQSATQQLAAWNIYPGYYSSLQTIFLDRSLQQEIRYLAIILFKNGIDKCWRHPASIKTHIPADHKNLIRSRLLQGSIGEDDKRLALHNALAAAKVIRIDYPTEWPTALSDLVGFLRATKNGNQPHLNGALLFLLRAVKELATARLRKSQTALQEVTPELFLLLGEIYSEQVAFWMEFLTRGKGDEDDADYAMESSLMCIKTLRRLMLVGYENPHKEQLAQEFWAISQTQFGQFLGHVSHDSAVPAPYQDVVGKHLLQFTKLHIEVCEALPTSFALLPNSIPLVHAYWDLVARFAEVFEKSGGIQKSASDSGPGSKSKVEGPLLERLALKGLLLLRGCIAMVFKPQQTFKYKSAAFVEEQEKAKETMGKQLLTDQFVTQIVDVIITKLFVFRKADLDAWEEDPQEWEAQERDSGDAWQWEVRPCAERVFLDLLIHYKQLLGPPLLSYFHQTIAAKAEDADLVSKEAVYTAMGCAAPTVYEVFDFDSFVTSTLVQDVQLRGGLAKLLRRRVAILLSQWLPIKASEATRPVVFEIYKHLMDPADETNDVVVRITAARQLKRIADDFEFKGEVFQPYAYETLKRLIGLLDELENDETKLAVLETLRALVDRMDTSVRQIGDDLMGALPKLWDDAGESNYMLKQSVLAILSTLVSSLGAESQRYHSFLAPLIRQAMDPMSEIHQFLVDEAAEVWKSTMVQCNPPLSPEMVELLAVGLPYIEYDTDLSQELVRVLRSYILLAPEAILGDERYLVPTLQALAAALDSKSRDQAYLAAKGWDYILRAAHELGGALGLGVLVRQMIKVGFMVPMLVQLHAAWESSQTTGPNRRPSPLDPIKEGHYLSILARIGLAEPRELTDLLSAAAGGGPGGQDAAAAVWVWLAPEWFGCFDAMADVERQKLSCLALTRLLEPAAAGGSGTGDGGRLILREMVRDRLQDFFSMWTTLVAEVQDGRASGPDSLVWEEGSARAAAAEWDTPQDVRERAFAHRDPVHREHTFEFVRVRLAALVEGVGGEARFESEWVVNVDRDVLAGFRRLSQGGGSGEE